MPPPPEKISSGTERGAKNNSSRPFFFSIFYLRRFIFFQISFFGRLGKDIGGGGLKISPKRIEKSRHLKKTIFFGGEKSFIRARDNPKKNFEIDKLSSSHPTPPSSSPFIEKRGPIERGDAAKIRNFTSSWNG